jgi:hypothetical protein
VQFVVCAELRTIKSAAKPVNAESEDWAIWREKENERELALPGRPASR